MFDLYRNAVVKSLVKTEEIRAKKKKKNQYLSLRMYNVDIFSKFMSLIFPFLFV